MFEEVTETEEKKPTDYSGTIIGLSLVPVVLLFIYLGKEDVGRAAAIALGMTLLAIRIRWDLRKQVWFWVVIAVLLMLHLPLFFLVRWPNGWTPAIAMLPIGVADCLIILGVLRVFEKLMTKKQGRQ